MGDGEYETMHQIIQDSAKYKNIYLSQEFGNRRFIPCNYLDVIILTNSIKFKTKHAITYKLQHIYLTSYFQLNKCPKGARIPRNENDQ